MDDERRAQIEAMMNDLKVQAEHLREQMEKMREELREMPRRGAR
jgi:hypothetical protein